MESIMTLLVTDSDLEAQLIAQRQASGGDRYDEVWEGLYVMAPLANNEHQKLQTKLVVTFQLILGLSSSAEVFGGANVSDRDEDWQYNYRCPDVLVFLPGNPAINRDTHWQGGPDFLVEVVSRDRAHEKIPFYASVGVREALFINRNPWSLELYRKPASAAGLELVGTASENDGIELPSVVLPMSLKLVPGATRPNLVITGSSSGVSNSTQSWTI
jgi:Uma2 family endonuclease